MIKHLDKLLIEFDGSYLSADELTTKFEEIAKSAIYSGYFLVNDDLKIRIVEVEFYFHSEDPAKSSVYDWGMYHIGTDLDYFSVGSLHPHNSGVDVTFERKGVYRASFLIRKYQVEGETEIIEKPTYLREDLFGYTGCICGNGPKIIWVNEDINDNEYNLIKSKRINLTAHNDDGSIKYDSEGRKVKDSRLWRFSKRIK